MWSQVLSLLALVVISSAYRQHAYSTKVKHIIPIKQDLTESQQDSPTIVVLEGEKGDSESSKNQQQTEQNLEKVTEQETDQKDDSLQSLEEQDSFYHSHYPKYRYEYGVKDYKTGDQKSQWEIRDGDVVKGEYTLIQPDGTQRIVRYKADDANGFEAEVKNIGKAIEQTSEKDGGSEGGAEAAADADEEIDVRSYQGRDDASDALEQEEQSGRSSDGGIAYSYNKLRQYL